MRLSFTKRAERYDVFSHVQDPKIGDVATHIGEVCRVEVFKSVWSDRPPVLKWRAYRLDGEALRVCPTRQEAAERLL